MNISKLNVQGIFELLHSRFSNPDPEPWDFWDFSIQPERKITFFNVRDFDLKYRKSPMIGLLSGNKLWPALFRKKSTFHGRHMNFYIQLLYMKTLLIYLIIFDTSLICQRVYERNWLNSSKACDLSSLEPKPTSLPENLLNCV